MIRVLKSLRIPASRGTFRLPCSTHEEGRGSPTLLFRFRNGSGQGPQHLDVRRAALVRPSPSIVFGAFLRFRDGQGLAVPRVAAEIVEVLVASERSRPVEARI